MNSNLALYATEPDGYILKIVMDVMQRGNASV